mgnify:CR=1 FL=1
MKPTEFKGSNIVFGANQPEYQPLPALALRDQEGTIITCWELTEEELQEVIATKKIYLQQLTFNRPLQPVYITSGLDKLATVEVK